MTSKVEIVIMMKRRNDDETSSRQDLLLKKGWIVIYTFNIIFNCIDNKYDQVIYRFL